MEKPNIENKRPPDLLVISKKLLEFSGQIPDLEIADDEDLRFLGKNFDFEPKLKLFIEKIGKIYEGQKGKTPIEN